MCYAGFNKMRVGMKIEDINITETIAQARKMLKDNKQVPAEFAALFSILLTVLEVLLSRLNKNSKNSSIPPSQDPNRQKTPKSGETKKKPGGQPGRVGKNLKPVENPDEIINVPVVRSTLPKGHLYKKVGVVKRQVVEFLVSSKVIEYQLEIVADENGKRFTAIGPEGTGRPIQYGASVKATAVYMGMYQLIPCGRVEEYFRDQAGIPISSGSLFNFNKQAFERLEEFERIAKEKLRNSTFLHSDETGINVNGKGHWLHGALNDKWTLFMPHKKRGKEAIDDMDILPMFKGYAIHDHWLAYFMYTECSHALCNAHHLRELQAVVEMYPDNTWAQLTKDLLLEINEAVHRSGGVLKDEDAQKYRERYREILKIGDGECPLPPEDPDKPKKRGKQKKTKQRNLLERLRDFEAETLRFMGVKQVPFTNNPGERDIRMTKVKQKISGCFKSFEGAQFFCRIRSYLLTAQKHGMNATDALNALFSQKLPDFCTSI
jgi:transposase